MQILMPPMPPVTPLTDTACKLLIARSDVSGEHSTVIIGDAEVIYFDLTGISYSSTEFFQDNFSVIREYADGEQLIVTQ